MVSVLLSNIFNLCETELSVLLRKMTGSLPGLAIKWLLLNHSIAFSFSLFFWSAQTIINVFVSSSNEVVVMVWIVEVMVLLSAELCKSEF